MKLGTEMDSPDHDYQHHRLLSTGCQTPGTECQNPAPACLVELDAFSSRLAGEAALPLWLLWATKPRYV